MPTLLSKFGCEPGWQSGKTGPHMRWPRDPLRLR